MSQVRKLQEGGSFTFNGRRLVGQQAIDAIQRVMNNVPSDEREVMPIIIRAIQSGDNVEATSDMMPKFTDGNGVDVSSKYVGDYSSDNSDLKLGLYSLLGNKSKNQRFRKSLRSLNLVDMEPVNLNVEEETPTTRKRMLNNDEYELYYNTDDEGNPIFVTNDATNIAARNQLQTLYDYSSSWFQNKENTNWADIKETNWDTSKLSPNALSFLESEEGYLWFHNLLNKNKENGKYLPKSLYAGIFDEPDLRNLKLYGITGKGKEHKIDNTAIDEKFEGDHDLMRRAGYGVKKDEDGYYVLTSDDPNAEYLNGNTYTRRLVPWLDNTNYDYIVDGGLYKHSDLSWLKTHRPDVYNTIGNFVQIRENLGYNDAWDKTNDIGWRFWGDKSNSSDENYKGTYGTVYDMNTGYNKTWDDYFTQYYPETTQFNIKDYSGTYSDENGKPIENVQLLSFIDPTKVNASGVGYIPQFVFKDPENNTFKTYNGINEFLADHKWVQPVIPNIGSFKSTAWDVTVRDKSGENIGLRKADNLSIGGNTVYEDRYGNRYIQGKNAKDKEWYRLDMNDKKTDELLNKWMKSPSNRNFEKIAKKGNRFKLGGEIPKFAKGKNIDTVATEMVVEKPSDSDVTQNAALGSHWFGEGLTSTDIWDLVAGSADLAGMGLAFSQNPYMQLASGASGLVGSITGLTADIKRDGFDGGDLGRFLLNATLDVGTAIPIVSSFAKSAKTSRSVLKFANAVGKVADKLTPSLALLGVGKETIDIINKAKNGEKWTVADAENAARAILSAALGAKSVSRRINSTNAAIEAQAKYNKKAKAKIDRAKTINVGAETKVKIKPSELESIIKNSEGNQDAVISGVIKHAKADGKTIDGDQAKTLLEKMGATVEKNGIKIGDKEFLRTGHRTYRYEAPKTTDYSKLELYFNDKKRADILGSDPALPVTWLNGGNRKGVLFDVYESKDITKLRRKQSQKKPLTSAEKGLLDAVNRTFSGKWKTNRGRPRKKYSTPEPMTPISPQGGSPLMLPQGGSRLMLPQGGSPLMLPQGGSRLMLPQGGSRPLAPSYITMPPNRGGQRIILLPETMRLPPATVYPATPSDQIGQWAGQLFKQGGKIQKFQDGKNFHLSPYDIGKDAKKSNTPDSIYLGELKPATVVATKPVDTGIPFIDPSILNNKKVSYTQDVKLADRLNKNEPLEDTYNRLPEKGKLNSSGNDDNKAPLSFLEDVQWNKANLWDAARAAYGTSQANEASNARKKALIEQSNYSITAPTKSLIGYNLAPINHAYDSAKKEILNINTDSSDPNRATALALQRGSMLANNELQRNAAISENIANTNLANAERIDYNNAVRADAADKRSYKQAVLRAGLAAEDATNIQEKYNILNSYGQQMAQQSRDAMNLERDAQFTEKERAAKDRMNLKISNIPDYKALKSEYESDPNKGSDSFEAWISRDASRTSRLNAIKTSNAYQGAINAYNNEIEAARMLRYKGLGAALAYRKLGGKLGLSAQERMAVEGYKISSKAASELSKLFLEMLKALQK